MKADIWTGDALGTHASPIYSFSKPIKSVLLFEDALYINEKKIALKQGEWWDALIEETQEGDTWAGYLSYDLAAPLFNLQLPKKKSTNLPLAYLFQPETVATSTNYQAMNATGMEHVGSTTLPFDLYESSFNTIQNYILDGDIYQINLTYEYLFKSEADPRSILDTLYATAKGPFGFFIDHPQFALASISPELFIRNNNGIVETRPMKGTRPLGKTPQEQKENREALNSSEKERAELSMITDLMRNDLCTICEAGSVVLQEPFTIQAYGSLLQRFSIITGKLSQEYHHPLQALKQVFPGGSISGCPKARACQRIYEIEQRQRGPYTGCAGFWNKDMWHWNMSIRTAIVDKELKKIVYPVGGGIVYGSELASEWKETKLKAEPILRVFGDR